MCAWRDGEAKLSGALQCIIVFRSSFVVFWQASWKGRIVRCLLALVWRGERGNFWWRDKFYPCAEKRRSSPELSIVTRVLRTGAIFEAQRPDEETKLSFVCAERRWNFLRRSPMQCPPIRLSPYWDPLFGWGRLSHLYLPLRRDVLINRLCP